MDRHPMAEWLAGLDAEAVSGVLDRRPDVVLGRPPATLGELAQRLAHPASVLAALRSLPLPCLQVMEALQALGEPRSRARLVELLDGSAGAEHAQAVEDVLARLTAMALVWPGDGDRLEVPTGLAEVFPTPLGLGPPAREAWEAQNADAVKRALGALGGRAGARKAESLDRLLALLADADLVRERAAAAPAPVADALRRMAWAAADDDDYFAFDPEVYRARRVAEQWGIDSGLLLRHTWDYGARMPAEVALALRGPGYRAPFNPHPPAVATRSVSPEAVESAAAAAVGQLATDALSLLDRLARIPVPRLAGGGIGARELARLAKELTLDEVVVRLVLELSAFGGLLEPEGDRVYVTDSFAAWRRTEPADQVASLLAAWWEFPAVPTQSRDAAGKALPTLRRREPCAGCRGSRIALLRAAAEVLEGAAADPAALATAARWARPLVHPQPQDGDAPLATVRREAELLGLLAVGALSSLGSAVLARDLATAHDILRRLLPQATDEAVFGSDLTALVAGTPSAEISALLDGCADRESRGGAVTWRFSTASVRRALDNGTSADELVAELARVATRGLPQPLTYLIGDVGRRHGRLRLQAAVSLIRSDDEALLAEVAADRRLADLGLQRVAPTVLGCAVPLERALDRLRDVGYLPVPDASTSATPAAPRPSASGDRPLGRVPRTPSPRRTRETEPEPPEPQALARRLLAAGDTTVRVPGPGTAAELARSARQLSGAEVGWLAGAVDDGGRVSIEYQAAGGAVTRRTISDPQLIGGMVYAWCELRQDERVFTASRILSVAPAR